MKVPVFRHKAIFYAFLLSGILLGIFHRFIAYFSFPFPLFYLLSITLCIILTVIGARRLLKRRARIAVYAIAITVALMALIIGNALWSIGPWSNMR